MENNNQHEKRVEALNGTPVEIVSYKIGDFFYCHVSNTDPGATIARGKAEDRASAEKVALEKAARRL